MYLDEFYHVVDSFVHVVAIGMNVLLLYLILTKSSMRVKEYKALLLVACFGDLTLAVVVMVGEPALLYEEGYFILVADGFFHGRNAIFDFLCVATYCGLIHANCVIVVVQFVWRYQLICQSDSGTKPFVKTWKVLIPITWCLLQAANTFYLFAFNDPRFSSVTNLSTAFHHMFYMRTLGVGYGIVVWCQYKIIKHMDRHGKGIRESTLRAQKDINRAMIALAISPLLTSMGPTFILVGAMVIDYSPGAITVYLSVGMSMITLVNPLTTIYFVRPYRQAVLGVFRGKLMRTATSRVYSMTGTGDTLGAQSTQQPSRQRMSDAA